MNGIKFLSKIAYAASLSLVLAFTLSCSDSSLNELLGDSSSSNHPSSSSLAANNNSSSSSEDENIRPAAIFASQFFDYIAFPFISAWSSVYWHSLSEGIEWYIDSRDDEGGEAFKSIFNLLSDTKAEYLLNGKFKRYIELLAIFIPHSIYVGNGWGSMVRQLLAAYEDLKANPGSFSEIYEIMEGNDGNKATYAYGEILEFVSDPQREVFILEEDVDSDDYYDWVATEGNVNRSAVVWAYSFWGRRYNENPASIEPIVEILRMLRDNYPE